MANPFQVQSRRRKVVYIGLILALFTASYFWRTVFIRAKAEEMTFREQDMGEMDLSGSAIRLSLSGLRGFVTSYFWFQATDKQKKNQWNELSLTIKSLTTLQPHFITPWLFQGWNLAYNVSVESDRVRDKLYYISEGTLLLAKGDRQNRNQPDLRFHIGFFNQHKISNSDETNSLRSLYQLACIHPNDRDPNRFRVYDKEGKREIRWSDFIRYGEANPKDTETLARITRAQTEFEKFCTDHPMLVRRLQNALRRDDVPFKDRRTYEQTFICETVDSVIRFLDDSHRLPCVYIDQEISPPNGWRSLVEMGRDPSKDKRPLAERFPPMPPPLVDSQGKSRAPIPQIPFDLVRNEFSYESELPDDFEANTCARAWFGFAQEPIPAPGELPGSTKEATNPGVQRKPRNIATLIFRGYPARAQSYIGEKLYQEGWYDDEGFTVRGWFPNGKEPLVGNRRKWALVAWEEAGSMWRVNARENHLHFDSPIEEANMKNMAEQFRSKYGLIEGQQPNVKMEDIPAADQPLMKAYNYYREYVVYRQMSNFPFHFHRANMEEKVVTNTARKRFFQAEGFRNQFRKEQALRTYRMPDALTAWRNMVLTEVREVDTPTGKKMARVLTQAGSDSGIQEDSYEIQVKYLDLANDIDGPDMRVQLTFETAGLVTAAMQATPGSSPGSGAMAMAAFTVGFDPRKSFQGGNLMAGPFDGTDDLGKPLYTEIVKMTIDGRYGLAKPPSEMEMVLPQGQGPLAPDVIEKGLPQP